MIFRLFETSNSAEYDVDYLAEAEFPDKNQHLLEDRPPGQIAFNKAMIERDNPKPTFDVVDGPWMSNEAVLSLPAIRNDFDQNRSPERVAHMQDEDKTEAQRREAQIAYAKSMADQDQPTIALTPPPEIRDPVDRATFNEKWNQNWLSAQRDAAMAQNERFESNTPHYPEDQKITPEYRGPER
ncbi:MAG: hypothetical protein ACSHYC_00175 [Alphaproteobacteria bacterium]